jgi:hypothetical protein
MRYLLMLFPSICIAAWITPDGEIFDNLPRKYGNTGNISASWAVENGWTEISALEAAELRCERGGGEWVDGSCVTPPEPEQEPSFPQPDLVVPTLDINGNQVGTARILVDAETLAVIAVIDTASPQRPWSEQRAAFSERQQRNANAASVARSVKANAAKIGNSPVARELERLAELIESIIETPNRQSE